MSRTLLKVEDLHVRFGSAQAVGGVSFSVDEGEALGIVGESGCGKSVTALSIMRLIESPGEIAAGAVSLCDETGETNLLELSEKQLENILGSRISMIFQDPMTSLNPVLSIGYQIAEMLRVHRRLSARRAKEKTLELLHKVGIPGERSANYPHEFSGGMRQRAMIAMAIACEPRLLIADEPTTALDVSVQAQILKLLSELKAELAMSVIIITHDLGVVGRLADRVAVMYAGKIVENAPVEAIFEHPQHPYTQALIASVPRLGAQPARLTVIDGTPPRLAQMETTGCAFSPRCPFRLPVCDAATPVLKEFAARHTVACHVAREGASADV